jgi:hypothetical protein
VHCVFPLLAILVLGDSHLAGPPGHELKRGLEERGFVVTVRAKGGSSARSWKMPKDAHRFDVVLLMLGTNDVPGWRTSMAYLKLNERHRCVVSIGPPAYADGKRMLRMANVLTAQMNVFGSRSVSSFTATWPLGQKRVHFDKKGAKVWIDGVVRQLVATILRKCTCEEEYTEVMSWE